MLRQLNEDLDREKTSLSEAEQSADHLSLLLEDLNQELKATKRQRIRDILKHPDQEELLEETYEEMEKDLQRKIEGLKRQLDMLSDRRNVIVQANRVAKTAMDVFEEILAKEKLERGDLELMVDHIRVFEDHLEIRLQADMDSLLGTGAAEEPVNFKRGIEDIRSCHLVQRAAHRKDKVFDAHVISDGDPLEIYTDKDGEVILKKYSPIGEISNFAKDYTESLFRSLGHSPASPIRT